MNNEPDPLNALVEELFGTVSAQLIFAWEGDAVPEGARKIAELETEIVFTGEQLADALGITPEELAQRGEEVAFTREEMERLVEIIGPGILKDISRPRRGTPGYHRVLEHLAEVEELEKIINAMKHLWADFGWKGILDLMAKWVRQIDTHPHLDADSRDALGVVNIGTIIMIGADEEQVLRMAADHAKDMGTHLPPHQAFRQALHTSQRAAELARAWEPHFHNAFAAARETPYNERYVFAALYHAPGRENRHDCIQAALMLATAAMGVRNRPQLTRAFLRSGLPDDGTFIDNGAINPRWRAGYRRS